MAVLMQMWLGTGAVQGQGDEGDEGVRAQRVSCRRPTGTRRRPLWTRPSTWTASTSTSPRPTCMPHAWCGTPDLMTPAIQGSCYEGPLPWWSL